ncbi:transporter, cation channel family protein [Opisthorchis viverrini]|uniref:Transporter, cation channel family protein n=1 Tax=Opisthorchis viverrini TaxID=6198 RepID=A0A1S8WGI5_OPIVI|nr:transporter, cation channel family protein [Opisthorchis viverrini]
MSFKELNLALLTMTALKCKPIVCAQGNQTELTQLEDNQYHLDGKMIFGNLLLRMQDQPALQRASTVRRSAYRASMMSPGDSGGIGALAASVGLQQQSSVRRTSVMQRYVGEIEFTGMNQTAKFCKLDSSTNDTVIRDLLKRKWGLKPPTLIITVFGTDFEKKRKLKMIFKKGLWKAAESGCWIVTGGFHLGIMKLTGEAVRDYTDAYGGNRMMAFGVASWDCVMKNELLEAALHEGTAVYQSEEDDEEQEDSVIALNEPTHDGEKKTVRTDIEERALDPNHNYFVLVDSGVSDQAKGKEAECRARFERCISQWSGAKIALDQSGAGGAGAATTQSGGITSSTHLQATQSSSQTGSNVTNQSNVTLQREGSASGPAGQQSSTSVNKGSKATGGSSTTSGTQKPGNEQTAPGQAASGAKQAGEKSLLDLSGKLQKTGKSVGGEEDILVPMCGLVVGGDRFTVRQVYCSVIQNRCPIVVTKGTSGAADVIAFGLDAASKMATEEVVDDKEPVPLETRIESIIEEFLGDMHPDYTSYTEEVNMLCEIINDYSNLVTVFDMEEDSDLDGYVISSLLASAGSIVASDQINLEQLEITLTLNRADIAREKIFLENKKWRKGQLNDYMYQALMSDRHDFVKLFLEQGFSLEEFLTVYMLEKLYTDQLKNMNSKVAIFNKMWEYNRSHRQSSKVALRDVGKVIKALVGDFYHPLYLSKEFHAKLMPEKRLEEPGPGKPYDPDAPFISDEDSFSYSDNSYDNGAISPRTLGLRERVRFIDHGEEHERDWLAGVHPPGAGFQNPAFLEQDRTIRVTARRGATSGEPGRPDGDDSDGKGGAANGTSEKLDLEEKYNQQGIPRSSTTVTTVSGDILLPAKSPKRSADQRDQSQRRTSREHRRGRSPPPYEGTTLRQNAYARPSRNGSQKRGQQNDPRYTRRRPSLDNMHDIPIPGQPLVYNAIVPAVNRSAAGYGGTAYTSFGPGHFRITGRAPLAYDASVESSGIAIPLNRAADENVYVSRDNINEQPIRPFAPPAHSDVSSFTIGIRSAGAFEQGGLRGCWRWVTSCCVRILGRSSSKDRGETGMEHQDGMKGREFTTLRAMAALAAATAVTAVADPSKAPHTDEEQTKAIQLDRPARELLIWSILVGKLRMAELFWTMEKEPIAAALLASILLTSLGNKTDDFTDKEDYRSFAKNFQERAEGVLNECYREDEHRTQLIINHELMYYGRSSVIKLAAEGQSIKFMAHPCCQDFLTNTWNGNLSTKNSVIRYFLGIICGLTIPFLIPKIILAKPKTNPVTEEEETSTTVESANVNQEDAGSLVKENAMVRRKSIRKSFRHNTKEFIAQIRDFYMAPVIRFVYNTISYMAFLILFSYLLLVDFKIQISVVEYIVIAWVVTLLIEEIKQAVLSGISFRTYISDGWNKLDCTGLGLFIIGFVLRMIVLLRIGHRQHLDPMHERFYIVTDLYLDLSRISLAISLFVFYIRLMYTFSFNIALGPKLIMIGKMVTNDLIPFMIILTVIMVGYAVAAQSIAYPNGLFTKENMTLGCDVKQMNFSDIIFAMYTTAYFQMFGDFSLDALQGEGESNLCVRIYKKIRHRFILKCFHCSCSCDRTCQNNMCPTKTSRWLVPIMLGFYVLLTNILMFNLLIAMFSKTYEEIESASTYYWNYQRYQMINDYVHRSPLVPPIIIFWHFYEAYKAIGNRCASLRNHENTKHNPFCVRFTDLKKEREMVKWEHMKAMDYLREPSQKGSGKRGAAESRAVVFRGGGGGPMQGPVMDLKSEMSSVTEGIGMELEKRFKEIDSQFQRFNDVDSRLGEVTQMLTNLSDVVRSVTETQQRIMKQISELPTCQCNELTDEVIPIPSVEPGAPSTESRKRTKLEIAVQSALEAAKDSPVLLAAPVPGSDEDSSGSEEGGDPSADPVKSPDVSDNRTGRVIERNVAEHRLWRIAPFNFEKYPGMRMNVPPERMAWTAEYPDYFAYDACEEVLLYPSEDAHDGENENLRGISFNQYDPHAKIRRQSLLGRYRLDPTTGAPLNPMGRTGLLGKGLLPRWGPNHSIVICITRWSRDPRTGNQVTRSNRGVLQYIALERTKRLCIPWYLTDHSNRCELDTCVPKVISSFITRRARATLSEKRVDRLLKRLDKAEVTQIFKGYLDDQLNADSAWTETVVINIHEGNAKGAYMGDDFLKLFSEPATGEQCKWMEVGQSSNLRTSHNYILKSVAESKRAFY